MIRVDDFRPKEGITIKLSYAASARRRLKRFVRQDMVNLGLMASFPDKDDRRGNEHIFKF